MSNIDIRRFIDINILHHSISSVSSIRDTVVLLTTEGTQGTDKIYNSLTDYTAQETTTNYPNTTKYIEMYFANSGNKVRVLYGITSAILQQTIKNLPNEQIVVAYTGQYADIKLAAQTRETDTTIYGINQKILLGCTVTDDTDEIKNFAVKYSNITGAEMTIAAYLSQIDIYGINTVQDYAFTKEVITPEDNDDSILEKVLNNNMNIDMNIASAIRNLGGNLKDGLDIVNEYILIVLQQTLTDRLFNLLAQKIKGTSGLSAIYATMAQEFTRYITNGYLSTDKVWTYDDLTVTYNNKTYTIIEANTPLLLGYSITILPLSSLTEEDKKLHKTPPIYVIVADSYGIRKITVNGEVI